MSGCVDVGATQRVDAVACNETHGGIGNKEDHDSGARLDASLSRSRFYSIFVESSRYMIYLAYYRVKK